MIDHGLKVADLKVTRQMTIVDSCRFEERVMKTLIKSTLVASMVAMGAWSVALAEGHSTGHYYIGIQGAVGPVLSDSDFFAPTSNAAQPLNGDVESDNAFLIGVQGGMFLDENWRVGGEIYYTVSIRHR